MSTEADLAYAEFLELRLRGDGVDFEKFCEKRPGLAAHLRELHRLHEERVTQGDTRFRDSIRERIGGRIEDLPCLDASGAEPAEKISKEVTPRRPFSSTPSDRYSHRGELARGGMGVILKVWDQDLNRALAMKVTLGDGSGKDDPRDREVKLVRFLEEAQITGQLEHPGVVPVHEIGIDREGRVFFTMRLVKGRDLDAILDLAHEGRGGWSRTRILGVLVKVCEALAYAHSKGVIHRDLKPANIMVGRFGETYVMDWGLAKVIGSKDPHDLRIRKNSQSISMVHTERARLAESGKNSPLITMDGTVVGTPAYMSPEQAEGRIEEINERSDIYSVGAMLYALLAGHAPYLSPGAEESPYDILRAVLQGPPAPPQKIDPGLPPELVAICEKAMARHAPDRYESMMEMADDLRAYLEGHVVRAYRTGVLAEVRKWMTRNKALATAIALIHVLVVGGILAYVWLQKEARDEAFHRSYVANIVAADASLRANEVLEARRRLEACDERFHGWEWHHLRLKTDASLSVLRHDDGVQAVCFGDGGSRIFTAAADGVIRIWNESTGDVLRELRGHESSVTCMDHSVQGHLASGSTDTSVRLWRPPFDRPQILSGHEDSVISVAFSADGSRLMSVSGDGAIRVWNTESGAAVAAPDPLESDGLVVALGPGGLVAAGSAGGEVRLWNPDDRRWRALGRQEEAVHAIAIDPGGMWLAAGLADGAVHLRDLKSGKQARILAGHTASISSLAFGRQGSRLVSGSLDRTLRVWDPRSGQVLAVLWGHEQRIRSASFSPDGDRVVSGSDDGTARVWGTDSGGGVSVIRGPDEYISSVSMSADGRRLVAATLPGGDIQVWEASTGAVILRLEGQGEPVSAATIDPVGSRFVAGHLKLWIWDSLSRERLFEEGLAGHDASITSIAFRPASRELASASRDSTIRFWDLQSGKNLAILREHEGAVHSICFSPDGSLLASASDDGTVRLWDARSRESVRVLRGHGGAVLGVSFSADGRELVTGSADQTVRVWRTRSGRLKRTLRGHELQVNSVAFGPRGSRIVSASHDRTVKIWDASLGEVLLTLRGHELPVHSAVFSPDGSRIVSGSYDNTIRIWKTLPAPAR